MLDKKYNIINSSVALSNYTPSIYPPFPMILTFITTTQPCLSGHFYHLGRAAHLPRRRSTESAEQMSKCHWSP